MSLALPAPGNRVVLADLLTTRAGRSTGRVGVDAALIAAGALATGLAAQLSVLTPISPVPFTVQTATVLLVGTVLGPLRGSVSMLLYFAAGMVGVPWFAGHASGWQGASTGYLVGFVLAAAAVGQLARLRADRKVLSALGAMVAGNLVIYAVGASWLAVSLHVDAGAALRLGVWPFVATDGIKIALCALVLPRAWSLANRSRRGGAERNAA